MPCFLQNQKQHTTKDANYSRLITMIRWIIESVNGRIKKFKYFYNVVQNNDITTIETDLKNICAIINAYRPQISSTDDEENENEYKKIVELSKKNNPFIEKCKTFNKRILKNKKQFDPKKINFPILTEEYIQNLTKGVYQLKHARNYTAGHLDDNGNYLFEMYEEDDPECIVHIKLRSRFSSQTVHDLWVEYNYELRLTEGQNPILNYYCECKSGSRNLGMCAHVTSVLWYLGIARNNEELMKKRKCDYFFEKCNDCHQSL